MYWSHWLVPLVAAVRMFHVILTDSAMHDVHVPRENCIVLNTDQAAQYWAAKL